VPAYLERFRIEVYIAPAQGEQFPFAEPCHKEGQEGGLQTVSFNGREQPGPDLCDRKGAILFAPLPGRVDKAGDVPRNEPVFLCLLEGI
jgi:hypothetical protein